MRFIVPLRAGDVNATVGRAPSGAFAIWRYHTECESRSDIAYVAQSLRD